MKNLYKNKYFIVFYDKDDEQFKYSFDNVREILEFMKKPVTRTSINQINVELYRALKSNHTVKFLTGEELTVHIIDADDEKEETMSYVKIQSNITINVTPGLQATDNTLTDLHVADRLKVAPTWPRATIQIKQGVGYYPEEITSWHTVQVLNKKNIITIGETVDQVPDAVVTEAEFKDKIEAIKTDDIESNAVVEDAPRRGRGRNRQAEEAPQQEDSLAALAE